MKKLTIILALLACVAYSATQPSPSGVRFHYTFLNDGHELTLILQLDRILDTEFAMFVETESGFQLVTCTDLTDASTRVVHDTITGEPVKITMEVF